MQRIQSSKHNHYKQRGVAVITVLLFVAVVSVIAVSMHQRLNLHIQRSSNFLSIKQAYWYALGGETLAIQLLKDSAKTGKDGMFHLGQDWAVQGMTFPVDGGTISGEINDLQACFNLNGLREPDANSPGTGQNNQGRNGSNNRNNGRDQRNNGSGSNKPGDDSPNSPIAQFQRLLDLLSVQGEVSNEALAHRLFDWMDANNTYHSSQSLEEDDYAGLEIPYLNSNTFLASLSELRLISGFTPDIIDKLKPYVCVLPQKETLVLNVNTIPTDKPELLAAMIDGLDVGAASEVLSTRPEDGFKAIEDFWGSSAFTNVANIDSNVKSRFGVKSEYFQLVAKATYDKSVFFLTSTLKVDSNSRISVIQRKFGGEL